MSHSTEFEKFEGEDKGDGLGRVVWGVEWPEFTAAPQLVIPLIRPLRSSNHQVIAEQAKKYEDEQRQCFLLIHSGVQHCQSAEFSETSQKS